MNKKRSILPVLVVAAMIISGIIFKQYFTNVFYRAPADQIVTIPEQSRLLVVAPHCDDETLGSAGLIQEVLNRNGSVKVILITNGDGSSRSVRLNYGIEHPTPEDYISMGSERQQESVSALQSLGVSKKDIYWLGYPDGSMDLLWTTHWKADYPLKSRHTRTSSSPYENSYRTDAEYAGENTSDDLMNIIKKFQPTIVSYPHPNDKHRDHWAVHAFVKDALLKLGTIPPRELLYLVHWDQWPAPIGSKEMARLKPPVALAGTGSIWRNLALNDQLFQGKSKAIRYYKTQMTTMKSFLLAFERKNELYGEYHPIAFPLNREDSELKAIISGPKVDDFKGQLDSLGNIEAVMLGKTDERMKLELRAVKKLLPEYTYLLEVVLYRKRQEPVTLLAEYMKDKAGTLTITGSEDAAKCRIEAELDRISIYIPLNIVKKADTALINGRACLDGKIIDRTAWRVVRFSP